MFNLKGVDKIRDVQRLAVAVSSPLDFSNRTQKSSILHFGKVNKLQMTVPPVFANR